MKNSVLQGRKSLAKSLSWISDEYIFSHPLLLNTYTHESNKSMTPIHKHLEDIKVFVKSQFSHFHTLNIQNLKKPENKKKLNF